jgi:hypothetical protein
MAFTELEGAALRSIFSETPELAAGLEQQLAAATVTERENSDFSGCLKIRWCPRHRSTPPSRLVMSAFHPKRTLTRGAGFDPVRTLEGQR